MTVFRVCGCCLLLFALLAALGCGRSVGYVKKGPEVKTDSVKIADCTADPDTAALPRGHTLTWNVNDPGHTYAIHFSNNKPIASADPSPGQGQKVTGDFSCNYGGWISDSFCVYAYDLTKDGTTCKDPGVHVIPQ